jgi:hypothetical protein
VAKVDLLAEFPPQHRPSGYPFSITPTFRNARIKSCRPRVRGLRAYPAVTFKRCLDASD